MISVETSLTGPHSRVESWSGVHTPHVVSWTRAIHASMAGPTSSSTADVVQNKLNVLLAKQERLLSTWLPPRDPSTSDARTRAEIERDEDAIFTPTPAT